MTIRRINDTPYDEAHKQAILKYQAKSIKQIPLRLNRNTDADIIEWLDGKDSVNGYLKDLIRRDIRFNHVSKNS